VTATSTVLPPPPPPFVPPPPFAGGPCALEETAPSTPLAALLLHQLPRRRRASAGTARRPCAGRLSNTPLLALPLCTRVHGRTGWTCMCVSTARVVPVSGLRSRCPKKSNAVPSVKATAPEEERPTRSKARRRHSWRVRRHSRAVKPSSGATSCRATAPPLSRLPACGPGHGGPVRARFG